MGVMFDLSRDVRIIPCGTVYGEKPIEIRFQAKGIKAGQPIHLSVSLKKNSGEERLLKEETFVVDEGAFAYLSFYLPRAFDSFESGENTLVFRANEFSDEMTISLTDKHPPVIEGGFIMYGPPNDRVACDLFRDDLKHMTDDDWRNYLAGVKRYGQEIIIVTAAVQYLSIKNNNLAAHYPSELYPKSDISAYDPIEATLSEADEKNMYVFLALGNNYASASNLDLWADYRLVMKELYQKYGSHPSLYGWYAACECNMANIPEEYIAGLSDLKNTALELSPVLPVLISPYTIWKEGEKGSDYAPQLHRLAEAGIDIMMPQDMLGQRPNCRFYPAEMSRQLYEALEPITIGLKKHLWGNCEGFNFTDDGKHLVPRFRGGGIEGDEGFSAQIRACIPYSEKAITFMLSGFFTPECMEISIGGEKAVKSWADYVAYQNKALEGAR